MTFSAPNYCLTCGRKMRFDGSSTCSWCLEARERLVNLKRSKNGRREAMRAGTVPSRPRIDVRQKSLADARSPRRAPIAAPLRRRWEAQPHGR